MRALFILFMASCAVAAPEVVEAKPADLGADMAEYVDMTDAAVMPPDLSYDWGGNSPYCNTCPTGPIPGVHYQR